MDVVSIIVPVYNTEKYLHRCIDSVLAQTYINFELLLIDDGSKDNSGKICDEYAAKDSRVQVFHKENGGVSSARNLGLEFAVGEYICFIDADDWVDAGYIETLLPANGEEMVVCSVVIEEEEKYCLTICDKEYRHEDWACSLNYLIEHMTICCPWCKIMRRDIIERYHIRFDVKVSAGEDMLFVYDYISTGLNSVRTISAPLYHYYVADNTSLSHRVVDFSTTEYVLDCIKQRVDNLSRVYNWDSNDGYKRHISTQFNNFIIYIKSITSFSKRFQFVKRVVENKHVRLLLSDTEYVIKRKQLSGLKAFSYRMALLLLKLYYLFK